MRNDSGLNDWRVHLSSFRIVGEFGSFESFQKLRNESFNVSLKLTSAE
jgi:hypothetical protein